MHQEGQKLAKLVESQTPDRPVPIVSFVARQRDLRDLVGKNAPGADQLNFADALRHWEGRFHTIVLEDRNLPVIAEKRVLRPKNEACRQELKRAFEQAIKVRPEVLQTLLTHDGDREMFRMVYPFSPALVQTLVAVSSVLQRERTALKIMLMLLVEQRDTLKVGDLIPCGDLWDMVAHGEEAFSDVMRIHFENAKRLYHSKLRPLLEETNEVNVEHDRPLAADQPEIARKLQRFDNDDRLVKTLLLSALVPEVEPLKNLTASRLAALNHGTIKAPVPGAEARIVLSKVRTWASRVGEIRVGEGPDPSIAIQVFGVDTEAILEKAKVYDNTGNRIRKVRELLFESLGVADHDEMFLAYSFVWRGSRRRCDLLYANVRELPDESLKAQGEDWKVVIDWPFDDPGHTPVEDHAKVDGFLARSDSTRTLVWLPAFFSLKTQAELGKLVILDHLLRGDNLDQYAGHLSLQDRLSARLILENQQSALAGTLRLALNAAYGIAKEPQPGMLDVAHEAGEGHFRSLDPGFTSQVPVATDLKGGLEHLLGQVLEYQFPAHPHFEREVKKRDCEVVLAEVQKAARLEEGRVAVDKVLRPMIKLVANPLGLGHMGEQYFVLEKSWQTHFNKQLAAEKLSTPTVEKLRASMDLPKPKGLETFVGNLLILTYAEQTNRAFYWNTRPFPNPALDNLRDDMELRQQELPDEHAWDEARRRAKEVFGLGDFETALLTAANVAALAARVQELTESHREVARHLTREVRVSLARMGLSDAEIAQAPRWRTAHAAEVLVSDLVGKDATAAIRNLAQAKLETSAAAIGTSLGKASGVVDALRRMQWQVFDAAARIQDERRPKSEALLEEMTKALSSDEYAVALESHLDSALTEALRLVTSIKPPPPPPPPPPPDGWKAIKEGDDQITPGTWEAQIAKLKALMGDGDVRLEIRWSLQKKGPR